MTRVLVSCWAGMGNVGDYWLLATAIDALGDFEVGALLEPAAVLPTFASVESVRWPLLRAQSNLLGEVRRFRRELRSWDCVVCFGGGWLAADRSTRALLKWDARLALVGVPLIGVGLGVGPFRISATRTARRILQRFDALTVRTQSDAIATEHLTGVRPSVQGDCVLLASAYTDDAARGDGVLVSLPRPYDHWLPVREWPRYRDAVRRHWRTLESSGRSVRFISFQHPEDSEFWAPLGEVIAPGDPATAIATIRRSEMVVAGRLHAALASVLTLTPVVTFGYHHKFAAVADLGVRPRLITDLLTSDLGVPAMPNSDAVAAQRRRAANVFAEARRAIG